MNEYFRDLSNSIAAVIKAKAPKCNKKEFQHLLCDGAVCDSKHHNVLYEDDNIRVVDVILDAHEDEIFHRHERSAIMYVDKPANIEYYEDVDNPEIISWSSNNPESRFNIIPFEAMHKVKNVDNRQFRAFRIELCADIMQLPNQDALLNEIHELVQLEKKSLDYIRKIILHVEPNANTKHGSHAKTHKHSAKKQIDDSAHTPFLNHYSVKRKTTSIRKNEVEELEREAKRFCMK